MIRHFKLILICCLLFFSIGIQGQDSISIEEDARINGLNKLIQEEIDQQIRDLRYQYNSMIKDQDLHIDSLLAEISLQKEEHKKLKRTFLISLPSIIALLILCVVLFFLLFTQHKEQTDRKISALKKYTHSEIEDSKNDLLNKLKKRIKKISVSGNKRKKEKSKKSKKEKDDLPN